MVSFYVYDITFFVLFTIGVIWFLYTERKYLSREGWMFMYRTKWGVKAMDWFDKKFHNVLGGLRYVIVTVGFLLMGAMIWLLYQTVWIYVSRPEITDTIKAPPVAPLIPYFPELFGLKSLFPPFYFTYFLVALAIVAIVHEFSHGIYMRYSKTKIKSTGLVFLGPILGAFVEEDQKSFHSKNRFNQMSVLAAGVFANVIFALLFYLLYIGFFYLTFSASGFVFNSYAISAVNTSFIDQNSISADSNFTSFVANGSTFYLDDSMVGQLELNQDLIIAYYDSPAFTSQMVGIITSINGEPIGGEEDLSRVIGQYAPGDAATITTLIDSEDSETREYDITFAAHPFDSSKAYLGVGYYGASGRTVFQKALASLASFRTDSTYYAPKFEDNFVYFVYHLLWWVMIINLLVALFNMLPLGILDGGRFFYLAVEKYFGKKRAEVAFRWSSKIIFGVFILLLLIWLFRIV